MINERANPKWFSRSSKVAGFGLVGKERDDASALTENNPRWTKYRRTVNDSSKIDFTEYSKILETIKKRGNCWTLNISNVGPRSKKMLHRLRISARNSFVTANFYYKIGQLVTEKYRREVNRLKAAARETRALLKPRKGIAFHYGNARNRTNLTPSGFHSFRVS